jgi:hypothetical protein
MKSPQLATSLSNSINLLIQHISASKEASNSIDGTIEHDPITVVSTTGIISFTLSNDVSAYQ